MCRRMRCEQEPERSLRYEILSRLKNKTKQNKTGMPKTSLVYKGHEPTEWKLFLFFSNPGQHILSRWLKLSK